MLTITNEDCMDLLKRTPDKFYDLAICDPPYGIEIEQRVFKDGKKWDDQIPSAEYFTELFRVSKNQIIWGGNYFTDHITTSKCWLIWDKKITKEHTFSMAELAWTSFDSNVKCFYQPPAVNRGFYKIDGDRIHPTQKSVDLYKWQLSLYAKPNDKILDTHLGSGSIAIACHDYGFDLTACELDKEYFDKAMERINNHVAQQKLF